jgi:hypothetical protein
MPTDLTYATDVAVRCRHAVAFAVTKMGLFDRRRDANPQHVFLSYAREDQAIATVLRNRLDRHGLVVWSDHSLRPGIDWVDTISQALDQAAAVVVVVTPNSVNSEWVTREWSAALRSSKRVIPVLASGAGYEDLPRELGRVQAVDLGADLEGGVEQIVAAVSQLTLSDEPPPSEFVDLQAIVEDVVEKKLANLGVDRISTSVPGDVEDPQMVFVVASFAPGMEPAFAAVDAAARAVGLRAERVKDVPGDYRITDRILASIRRAALVVVDLTDERPNVYFELGFARGLGKTVITILREGTKAHFDVQDWTYLPYIDSRPLENDLIERFEYELERREKDGSASTRQVQSSTGTTREPSRRAGHGD